MGSLQCISAQNCKSACEEEMSITQNIRIIKDNQRKDEEQPHLITFSKISLSKQQDLRISDSFAISTGEQQHKISFSKLSKVSKIKEASFQSKEQRIAQAVEIHIVEKISIKEFYDLKKMIKNTHGMIKELAISKSYFSYQLAKQENIQKQRFVKLKFNQSLENQVCYFRGFIIQKNQEKYLQGFGEIYFSNGAYYNGCFKNNQFSEKGLYIHPDKDYYFGSWKSNAAHGFGEFRHYQGVLYAGQWVNDEQNGVGQQYWPDGAIFRGLFQRGHKKRGKFSWPNNSYYEGQFVHDQFEGQGNFFWEDSRTYQGRWKANKMHGLGVFKWPNGQIFSGKYLEDKKNGKGELILSDGTIVRGRWLNGKLQGMSEIIKNGSTTKVAWKDGIQVNL